VPIKVARIFNTYGPRMHRQDGRVVSNFILQALLDQPITIYGDGSQTRSFCYVDDLIDGLMRLMDSPAQVIGPINIGNTREFTILQLAEMIIEITGSRSKIVRKPLPSDDPRQRQPDIAKARAVLGWEPTVEAREGIERTVAYFRTLLAEEIPAA
jgi:UDP-glucuronate decarboxylase